MNPAETNKKLFSCLDRHSLFSALFADKQAGFFGKFINAGQWVCRGISAVIASKRDMINPHHSIVADLKLIIGHFKAALFYLLCSGSKSRVELKKPAYDSGLVGCNSALRASHNAAFFYLPKLLRLKEKAGEALAAYELGIFGKHLHTSISRLKPSFKDFLITSLQVNKWGRQ